MKIIQFNLNNDSKSMVENIILSELLDKIDLVFKKHGFIKEIDGIYKSHKSDSVKSVLVAQDLIKSVPHFKDFVRNFKMYNVIEENSFSVLL